MTRKIIGTVLALLALMPRGAQAQTEQVYYYHTDAIGSVRAITDANNQVVERHDFQPFGEEPPGPPSTERRLFTGKERDSETSFDYSGARYYLPQSGRFTSPDPISANDVRLVVPQQWNRYSYAANNPLTNGDPDGRDVVVFNYMSGAAGFGHVGILAIDPTDGSARYGGFNPAHDGWWNPVYDPHGAVTARDYPAGTIQYENGRPTPESLGKVAAAVAALDKQGKGPIRGAFFKTTDAQTAQLRDFIKRTQTNPGAYFVGGSNCQVFCILGLRAAGIEVDAPTDFFRAVPNVYFALTLSELAWRLGSSQQPRVETSYCFNSEKGCAP